MLKMEKEMRETLRKLANEAGLEGEEIEQFVDGAILFTEKFFLDKKIEQFEKRYGIKIS